MTDGWNIEQIKETIENCSESKTNVILCVVCSKPAVHTDCFIIGCKLSTPERQWCPPTSHKCESCEKMVCAQCWKKRDNSGCLMDPPYTGIRRHCSRQICSNCMLKCHGQNCNRRICVACALKCKKCDKYVGCSHCRKPVTRCHSCIYPMEEICYDCGREQTLCPQECGHITTCKGCMCTETTQATVKSLDQVTMKSLQWCERIIDRLNQVEQKSAEEAKDIL